MRESILGYGAYCFISCGIFIFSISISLSVFLYLYRNFFFRGLLSKHVIRIYAFHRYIINHKTHSIIFTFTFTFQLNGETLTVSFSRFLYLFYAIPFPSQFLLVFCGFERREKKKLEIVSESKEQLEQKATNIKGNEQKKSYAIEKQINAQIL